jgi:hypothetical protein
VTVNAPRKETPRQMGHLSLGPQSTFRQFLGCSSQ